MLANLPFLNSILDTERTVLHGFLAKNSPNPCESGETRMLFLPVTAGSYFVKSPTQRKPEYLRILCVCGSKLVFLRLVRLFSAKLLARKNAFPGEKTRQTG
jgi:hypothetical protein